METSLGPVMCFCPCGMTKSQAISQIMHDNLLNEYQAEAVYDDNEQRRKERMATA